MAYEAVMSDRRTQPRIPFRGQVHEITPRGRLHCRALNIAEGGLFLRRTDEGGVLLDGERLFFEVQLDRDPDPLWLMARVVNQVEEPFHDSAAVEFVEMPRGDRERLRRHLASYS